ARKARYLDAVSDTVDRAAKLTGQLLAFACRQPLAPQTLNVGRLVREMEDVLRRVLGEAVEIETLAAPDSWNVSADPAQLENVILNLAINARDAMQGHGTLTVQAANRVLDAADVAAYPGLSAGEHVLLAIGDTGPGMAPDVLSRAFEPFFTTKPAGKGTGLGLSMVYGFVKQSGGQVGIETRPGEGTRVKIWLPRVHEAEVHREPRAAGPVVGGAETILVVEDDAAVLATTVEALTDLGYCVLKAHDGESALSIVHSGVPIDLLFTDVIMPGPVRSPELARQAKAALPDLEILFTSGYTEDEVVHDGRLDPGVQLISKPYGREELARRIRQLLQAAADRRGAGQGGKRGEGL
ncbi:MAG: ATP-binding protein, partial [Gammaproteobacteria bacterium]